MKNFPVIYLTLFYFLLSLSLAAQSIYPFKGVVRDADTQELLSGVTITVENLKRGTSTDVNGSFSIELPSDSNIVSFTYPGYKTLVKTFYISGALSMTIELSSEAVSLQEVVVEADNYREQIANTQMSATKITVKEAKLLPALFGEVDLLKVLQLKPGIRSSGEGSSGIYVRGGGADQNLFLLDQAIVYNPTHLFGFFSVFNPDAVRSIELYKGAFPSQFGGRLSSVIDVEMNEGSMKEFKGAGGIGLISSRLSLEGPIVKDKLSLLVSGRRTYFDIFTRMINKSQEGKKDFTPIPDYFFYDFNAKVVYNVDSNNRLFLSGYFGNDVFGFSRNNFSFDFSWGNKNGSLRWYRKINRRLFSNAYLIYSNYNYKIENSTSAFNFSLGSRIWDYQAKLDFDYALGKKHALKFGGQVIQHHIELGRLQAGTTDGSYSVKAGQNLEGSEFGVYVSDDFDVNARWKLNWGLRFSGFYKSKKFYSGIEPRISARFKLNEFASLKGSFSRMFQYIHLASNSGASLPTDMWYPSNKTVRPQRSDQAAAGISISMFQNKFLFTNELYYKWMKNQIDFRDNAQIYANDNLDQEFVFGRGYSYGNEVYFEKKSGKTTGWVGYTLSWTWRDFDYINNGNPFPAQYDRRHDISVVIMQQISKRISASFTWVYGTGSATSLPVERFYLQDLSGGRGKVVPVYTERNAFRMAPFHRMDLGLVYKFKPKWGESDLTFSIYNAYNRRNPYFLYFEEVKDELTDVTIKFQAKQVALFPIIPSLTYNFKF